MMNLVGVACMVVLSGCIVDPWPPQADLDEIASAIQADLDRMDADLADAAQSISQTGLTGDATRATLRALCADYPHVVDCGTIDMDGILTTVEPEAYADAEGADISDQAQVIQVQQTAQPVMSELFIAVEGFPALDFEYPLIQDGTMIGSASMLIKPADYLGGLVAPFLEGTDDLCMVVQHDGVILYDVDPEQIGKDTFNDPMYEDYPDLLAFAERYLATTSGADTYTFTDSQTGRDVTKYARWTTVHSHDTSWCVLLIREGR